MLYKWGEGRYMSVAGRYMSVAIRRRGWFTLEAVPTSATVEFMAPETTF